MRKVILLIGTNWCKHVSKKKTAPVIFYDQTFSICLLRSSFLKTEFRQFTGSFKERGARNALLHHLRERGDDFKSTGAIAASAGNHALALAYHGQQLGVPVTVIMPTVAPLAKVDKCRVSVSTPLVHLDDQLHHLMFILKRGLVLGSKYKANTLGKPKQLRRKSLQTKGLFTLMDMTIPRS